MTEKWSAEHEAAGRKLLDEFDLATRRKGKRLAQQGSILLSITSSHFEASVLGNRVKLVYSQNQWHLECACGANSACGHQFAALHHMLMSPPAKVPRGPETFIQVLQKSLGRPPRQQEVRYVKLIQDLLAFNRHGRIDDWSLKRLDPDFPTQWKSIQFWQSTPRDEIEAWHYIAAQLEVHGCEIPDFMQNIGQVAPPSEAVRTWQRSVRVEFWRKKMTVLGTRISAPLTEIDLGVLLTTGGATLWWKKEPGSEFQPISGPGWRVMSDPSKHRFTPEALIIRQFFRNNSSDLNVGIPHHEVTIHELLSLPQIESRIVTQSGQPFVRSSLPLRWHVAEPTVQDGDYQLELVVSDGKPVPHLIMAIHGSPAYYVTADTIYAGPMLDREMLDPCKRQIVPAQAVETPAGLSMLSQLQIPYPARLEAKIRRFILKPRIFCSLKPTYPGSSKETLCLKAEASDPSSGITMALVNESWNTTTSGSLKDELFVVDRTFLDAVPEAFETLGAHWDYHDNQWQMRAGKNLPQTLIPWLDQLPSTTEVFLDEQLATLRQSSVAGFVDVECKESGIDWFDLNVVLRANDDTLTPEELRLLLKARGRYVRLGAKGWRKLEFHITREHDETLARLGLSPHDFSNAPQRVHALQLADPHARKLLPAEQAEQIFRRAGELKTRVNPPIPPALRAELRPYQIEGFHFLCYLAANRFGGILADDMGLGKTVQTLAWLAWLQSEPSFNGHCSLVVCPKSVMENWHSEAQRFLPGLRVICLSGDLAADLKTNLKNADLLVANYAQLRSFSGPLTEASWHCVILDEGQYIKNPTSITHEIACQLKSEYRLVLSGTPIENRLLDLWSLMSFSMPGVLGNRAQFAKRFDQKGDPLARRRLSGRVRPFLLRRTKNEVAKDLPARIEEDLYCEMEPGQKLLYTAELKRARLILRNIQSPEDFNANRFHFLTALLRLRQICCDPRLVSQEMTTETSAKVSALLDLLEPLMEEGHKVLVFSQFVSMLDLLAPVIQERKWKMFFLSGDTENRGELVNEFQGSQGSAVFLISLKAGGFGLNLTAASYVVLFDPWWNPAVENQAIDRTHRIGQSNTVIAYRLLIKESIEEKIRQLQKTKSAMVHDVLGEESFARSLTIEDLNFLFSGEDD